MATIVTGDQYERLDAKLFEIKRQIRQKGGYPYDPTLLDQELQKLVEGKFVVGVEQKILCINRNRPFNPSKFIGEGWAIVEEDARSLKLTSIDLKKIRLEHMHREWEGSITPREKLRRLKAASFIRLDAKVLETFWHNQNLIPELWWKWGDGTTPVYIYFDGTVVRDENRRCHTLCLCIFERKLTWELGSMDGADEGDLSAVITI